MSFQKITTLEAAYIEQTGRCPDCKTGEFLKGPSAGEMVNMKCDSCGHEFNLCLVVVSMSHRLPAEEEPTGTQGVLPC